MGTFGKFVLKRGEDKKKGLWRIHLKSASQSAKSDSPSPKNLANHFDKVIHNYPKIDSYLAI